MGDRQKELLKIIVETYIKTFKPISSKSLVDTFGCSSATIRNDMAFLEELGFIEKEHTSSGRIPSEKGYCGFPACVCTSVNEVVVHGIPSESCILNEGDIVSVDLVVEYKGYMADACRTYAVGEISPEAQHLIDTAEAAFFEGMKYAKVGNRLGDISHAIQQKVESEGFGVIRDFVGHGIGKDMHEEPQIPNYGKAGKGPRLVKGMTLAIEPMIVEGSYEVDVLLDDWTGCPL